MFHVEMRMGMNLVREFNLNDRRLWLEFLAPLMADRHFSVEGHEFTPRKTRIKICEGPELRPDQLAMGRGWQNVERTADDVTERVLQRAREHTANTSAPAPAASSPPTSADLVRERLHGRIAAGPLSAEQILATAAELMPDAGDQERQRAAAEAVWALIERGVAQLAPSDR